MLLQIELVNQSSLSLSWQDVLNLLMGALAIWQNDQYVFPIFQICQKTALVRPEIIEVLTALALDTSGWTQFLWLLQRNKLLGWGRPAVLLQTDPMAVLRAARLRSSD